MIKFNKKHDDKKHVKKNKMNLSSLKKNPELHVKKNEKQPGQVLLSVREAAMKIGINEEVFRRKLRNGEIFGIKASEKLWKVPYESIINYLNRSDNLSEKINDTWESKTSENCNRCPRWIEYSGLPMHLSQKYGLATWVVLKKLIEIDCFENEKAGVFFYFKIEELAEITGLTRQTLHKVIITLQKENYIDYETQKGKNAVSKFKIITPLRTPKSVNEILPEHGGIAGRPKTDVIGTCITRFF
ncbi:MAG: hypothetical protein QMC67_00235 [Candidatus Wallbacteria bacterium]